MKEGVNYMLYYKLISDNTFIGIATSNEFRQFQAKHQIMLKSDEEHGSYVYYNKQYYRDSWMRPVITNIIPYIQIDIINIDEEEYNALSLAIEKDEEVQVIAQEEILQEDPIEEEEEPIVEEPDITVEFIRSSKIKEMSAACRKAITDGFDLTLSDNEAHHFSLTVQDQLNLLTISSEVLSGETEIVYHADGEVCKYYSVEDATAIVNAATKHKTYHTTYYNSLKVYINSLNGITEISNIEYGVEIPEEYQSDILKTLIGSNNHSEAEAIAESDEPEGAETDNDAIIESNEEETNLEDE